MNKRKGKIPAFLMILIIGMLMISTFTLTIVPPASAPANNPSTTIFPWPMKNCYPNRTGYSTSPVPRTNHTLWTYDLGGDIYSDPVVADGLVFVGSVGRTGLPMILAAINMTTGASVWNWTSTGRIRRGAAVADGLVFVGTDDGKVYAINEFSGTTNWTQTVVGEMRASAPAVVDGVVYINSRYKVWALNAATGNPIWNYTPGMGMSNEPAVAEGKVFVGDESNRLFCLDATDGSLLWNRTVAGDIYESAPAVADGKVYVGDEGGNVTCFTTTGDYVWSYTTGGAAISTPAVADGKVYIGSDKLYCFDADTESLLWTYATDASIYISSPAVAGGLVFIGDSIGASIGKLYAINITTHNLVWSYQTGTGTDEIRSSPAVANGLVFITSEDNYVYAFGTLNRPVASFTFSPTLPDKNEVVTFDASRSRPGFNGTIYVPIANYTWDFGDGNVTKVTVPTITHSYLDNKTYTVNLTVTDMSSVSATAIASIIVGATPPTASFTFSPASPIIGEIVTFDASASQNGTGTIANYTWNFGDGNVTTVNAPIKTVTHSYTLARTYTVILTVMDNLSISDTDTKSITVRVVLGTTEYPWTMFHYDLNNTGYTASSAPDVGLKLWNQTIGWIGAEEGTASPAVADGLVFIGTQPGTMYCLNMTTGAILWTYTTGGDIVGSPAVAGGKVYIGSGDTYVYCLNESTGDMVWRYKTGAAVKSSPAVNGSLLYIGSDDGKLYCLDISTTPPTSVWNYTIGDRVESSPAVAGSLIFVASYDNKLYAINATGGLKWSYPTGDDIVSSPAVFGDKVFVGSKDGKVYCRKIDNSTGWTYTTGAKILSSPAVANNKVFVGDDSGNITCLTNEGAYVWNYTTGANVTSSPAVADGKVFVGSWDNKIYALNMTTGAILWTYITGGQVRGSPAVANGTVFIGSRDQNVYAFTEAIHDVAVIGKVTFSSKHGPAGNPYKPVTECYMTWTVEINVTVQNQGNVLETFTLKAFYGNATGNYTVGISPASHSVTLAAGASTNKTFTWDVPDLAKIACTPYWTYTIYANASVVQDETDTADNIRDGVVVKVKWHGDGNGDGKVGLPDLMILSMAYKPGTVIAPNYNPQADYSGDGPIGLPDLMILSMNYKKGPCD